MVAVPGAVRALEDEQRAVVRRDLGGEVVSMNPKQAGDYLNGEFTRWAKVVKDRNIKAE